MKDWCHLFYFVVSIGVATYSIIENVALVIETAERYFVYFIVPKLMFLAFYTFYSVIVRHLIGHFYSLRACYYS